MNAYEIITPYNRTQTHIVIAESMGDAEETFKAEYQGTEIEKIVKVSDYVLISEKVRRLK